MIICRQVRLYYVVGRRATTGFEGQRISIFGLRVDGLASLRSASRDVATAQGNVGPAHGQARQAGLVPAKASTEAAEKQLRSESRLRSPGSSQSSGGPCQAGCKESFQIQIEVVFI